ncbi:MAG TPA: hypothetical protein VGM54_03645 [Chthoniobacter sp.]|jgi:hypothetical protein
MKLGIPARPRISLQCKDGRWLLLVNREPVISATDRDWLQKIATKLRQSLAGK